MQRGIRVSTFIILLIPLIAFVLCSIPFATVQSNAATLTGMATDASGQD